MDAVSPARARQRYTGSRITSDALREDMGRNCHGDVLVEHTLRPPEPVLVPEGAVNTLFQAVRSFRRAGCLDTWVRGRFALKAVNTMPACLVPTVVSRW
jgi:hypothetical protein